MNKIFISILILSLSYASASQPTLENFVEIKTKEQFEETFKKPALLLYMFNRSWKHDYSSQPYFHDHVHQQVIEKLKGLATKNVNIAFAELEWSVSNNTDKLSLPWLQDQGIPTLEFVDFPLFLLFKNKQQKKLLVPCSSLSHPDGIHAYRKFFLIDTDQQKETHPGGTLHRQLDLLIFKSQIDEQQ